MKNILRISALAVMALVVSSLSANASEELQLAKEIAAEIMVIKQDIKLVNKAKDELDNCIKDKCAELKKHRDAAEKRYDGISFEKRSRQVIHALMRAREKYENCINLHCSEKNKAVVDMSLELKREAQEAGILPAAE